MTMASKNRIIVGMPQFVNPGSPETNSGSVNFALDRHPATHSDTYGGLYVNDDRRTAVDAVDADSREHWTKVQWRDQAKGYGLAVSGNYNELKARVEEYEAEQTEE